MVFQFVDDCIIQCGAFLKKIKGFSPLAIECIYFEDILCKVIYASRFYLQNMDKNAVSVYQKFKRERAYSDDENMILQNLN